MLLQRWTTFFLTLHILYLHHGVLVSINQSVCVCVSINQSKFTLNLKTATTSGGLQGRAEINLVYRYVYGVSMSPNKDKKNKLNNFKHGEGHADDRFFPTWRR